MLGAGMAATAGAHYAGQRFIRGGGEQQQLNAQLSGMGFANAMSPTGRGFGHGELNQIGSAMREFEAADPFTTMRDMNQMMDRFLGMGMEQGVQDAREFSQKFTKFTDAMRDIATTLGTTLDDASKFFGSMRSSGFYSSREVMGNVFQMEAAAGMGMGRETFVGMQSGAASGTRQMGMTGRAGGAMSSRFARDLLSGSQSAESGGLGLFTSERLMDITGAGSGAEAAAALGQRFTGVMSQFLQSEAGQALAAGVGEVDEEGRFTGGVSEAQMARFASGELGVKDFARIGSKRLNSKKGKASFMTNRQGISSSIMEHKQGLDTVYASIEKTATEHFRGTVDDDDAVQLFMQHMLGVREHEGEIIAEMAKASGELRTKALQRMREQQSIASMRLRMRRDHTLEGFKQKYMGGGEDWASFIGQAGADFGTGIDKMQQGAMDSILGIERRNITSASQRHSLRSLMSGETTANLPTFSEGDFAKGSTLGNLARGSGSSAATSMLNAAIMGGDIGGDLGLNEHQGRIARQRLGAKATKDEGKAILFKLQRARSQGDEGAAKTYLEEFKAYTKKTMRGAIVPGKESSAAAFFARELGSSDLARSLILEDSPEGKTFGAVQDIEGGIRGVASVLGLGKYADELVEGGPAAQALGELARAQRESGGADMRDIFAQLAQEAPDSFMNLSGEARAQALANMFNKRFKGGKMTAAGVSRVEEMLQSAGREGRINYTKGRRTGEAEEIIGRSGRVSGYHGSDASLLQMLGSRAEQGIVDTNVMRMRDSARVALGAAPEELRRALGDSYTGLMGAFEKDKLSGGDLSAAAEAVLGQVEGGALKGVGGGAIFREVAELRRRGRGATSIEGLAKVFGQSTEGLMGLSVEGVNLTDGMSASEKEALVKRLSQEELLGQITAGTGGGVFLRGESNEHRMRLMLDQTAEKVQQMSESVHGMISSVNQLPFLSMSGGDEPKKDGPP